VKIPPASATAVAQFEALAPETPGLHRRQMFGQPAAFLNGHMFFGVFGDRLFLRLSVADRLEAFKRGKMTTFEPMPGRPMKEYVVLPDRLLKDAPATRAWIERSMGYVRGLPPKKAGR